MPFVHVIMEPRDEESKHRIGREVADAVAEGTNNSIDGVQVIFHEVPRNGYVRGTSIASHRPRPAAPMQTLARAIIETWRVADEARYGSFRTETLNPLLARQEGFISLWVLRAEPGRLLVISKWINEQAARRWLESDQRRAMESDARTLGTSQDGDVVVADFVHQQFGALGGAVIGTAVDQTPAQIGGKQ